jgi:hypothetical protein
MVSAPYKKPYLTITQQLALIQQRQALFKTGIKNRFGNDARVHLRPKAGYFNAADASA